MITRRYLFNIIQYSNIRLFIYFHNILMIFNIILFILFYYYLNVGTVFKNANCEIILIMIFCIVKKIFSIQK